MNDNNNRISPKLLKSLSALIILILIFLLLFLIQLTNACGAASVVINSIQALIFGIIIACILSPLVNGIEFLIRKPFPSHKKPGAGLIRMLSIVLAMAIVIFAIISLFLLIIPQIGITLSRLLPGLDDMIKSFNQWIYEVFDFKFWQERIAPAIQDFASNIESWILNNFGVGTEMYKSLTEGLATAFNYIFNFFIGLIMAVYMLLSKEKLFAQIRKLSKAIFREKWGGFVSESIEELARIFSGFFGAKILEAILMGLLCFFGMLIFNFPYATLISVLVGAANIVPFFGPYAGAILGAAIIILVDPFQALWFIVFQIVLTQLDANIFGPRILGHKTGLSSFWVIVSILLFTGCFGFIGAFIGVPAFAWIYYMVKKLSENSLSRQGLPTKTSEYENPDN